VRTADGVEAFVRQVHRQLQLMPARSLLRTFIFCARHDPIAGERVDPPGLLTVIEFPRTDDEDMATHLRTVATECRAVACLSIMLCAKAEGDALGRIAYVHENDAVVALRLQHEQQDLNERTWTAPVQEAGTEQMSIGELEYVGLSNVTSAVGNVLPPKAN